MIIIILIVFIIVAFLIWFARVDKIIGSKEDIETISIHHNLSYINDLNYNESVDKIIRDDHTATQYTADLPATNLRVRVATASGQIQTSGTAISISAQFNGIEMGGSWINAKEEASGIFDLNLIDGNYSITAYPGSNQKLGKPQNFNITVESGTVTSIKQKGSASNLSAINGVFTLTLASSPIAGTVVAPDGTTPAPNSRIDLYDQNKVCLYCEMGVANSDQTGYFGFNAVSDGQYQMIARQPYADPTKADSLPLSVTVTGGMGSSTLVIPLRTPNVTGVVRGPRGVSVGNWIQVQKVTENNGRVEPVSASLTNLVRFSQNTGQGSSN
jgi:hypothetical protein